MDRKLWPYAAVTLRKRLTCLLSALDLDTQKVDGRRPFSLGSLRPGGATYLLLLTEDSELVRRRGRWVTTKVMELYLQEVLYTTYTERISASARDKVRSLAGAFPEAVQRAISDLEGAIPVQVWFRLFQAEDNEELGREGRKWKFSSPAFSTESSGAGAGTRCYAVKRGSSAECLTSSMSMDVLSHSSSPDPSA